MTRSRPHSDPPSVKASSGTKAASGTRRTRPPLGSLVEFESLDHTHRGRVVVPHLSTQFVLEGDDGMRHVVLINGTPWKEIEE